MELQFVEKQLARKKAATLKTNELQRTAVRSEKDENDEWDVNVVKGHESSPVSPGSNTSQRTSYQEPGRLTERQPSNPTLTSPVRSFVEKRNAKILQRDLEQKQKPGSDPNVTLTQHQWKALGHHQNPELAVSYLVAKGPAEQPDLSCLNRSPGTAKSGPPLKGFDRFLSILNQGVDIARLSDIVNAPEAETVKGTLSALSSVSGPALAQSYHSRSSEEHESEPPVFTSSHRDWTNRREGSPGARKRSANYGETPRSVDLDDKDSKDKEWRSRDKEWGSSDKEWRSRDKECRSRDKEWGSSDKEWRSRDKERHRRRHSDERRSRSDSRERDSDRDERKTEKKENLLRIQTLFQTVGLELGIEEVDQLNSRTQERLYGVKHPRGRGDHQYRQRHRDPSWPDSSDERSPDSHYRRSDSQEPRGPRNTECPSNVSLIDLPQSAQCSAGSYPVGPAPHNIPMSTQAQPPPANYSSYTASYHNAYDGQYHSASVQNWTTPYPSGPPPCYPQLTPALSPTQYQFPPRPAQYPPHFGPSPLLPQPPRPPHLPPPTHLQPPPHPPNPLFLPPESLSMNQRRHLVWEIAKEELTAMCLTPSPPKSEPSANGASQTTLVEYTDYRKNNKFVRDFSSELLSRRQTKYLAWRMAKRAKKAKKAAAAVTIATIVADEGERRKPRKAAEAARELIRLELQRQPGASTAGKERL